MKKKSILDRIMEENNLDPKHAKRLLKDCREAVFAALDDGDEWEVDDIILDYLGFEVSDIDDVLYG